jgi:hypothetical protein
LARFGDVVGDEARGEQVYRQILESGNVLIQLIL